MSSAASMPSTPHAEAIGTGDIAVPLALDAQAYDSAPFTTMRATNTETQVVEDTRRAGAVPDSAFAGLLAERAVAQVEAEQQLPVDAERFQSDLLLINSVNALAKMVQAKHEVIHRLAETLDAEGNRRADLPTPKGRGYRAGMIFLQLLMTTAVIVASIAFMWPGLLPMMASLAPDAADADVYLFAARASKETIGSVIGTLALAHAILALAVREKSWLRVGLTAVEVMAVVSLMALRAAGDPISTGILGYAGMEFAVLIASGFVSIGIGSSLDVECRCAAVYARSAAKIAELDKQHQRHSDELAKIETKCAEHVAIVQRRDDGSRRHEARRELVRLTAEAGCVIAVAEQLKTVVANMAEATLTERIETHLDERFGDSQRTSKEGADA